MRWGIKNVNYTFTYPMTVQGCYGPVTQQNILVQVNPLRYDSLVKKLHKIWPYILLKLLTESKVIIGKSQTLTLMYVKAKNCFLK